MLKSYHLKGFKKGRYLSLLANRDTSSINKEINDLVQNKHLFITIELQDVLRVISLYRNNKISLEVLVNWVNVVLFSDAYSFTKNEKDEVTKVLYELEEFDEINEVERNEKLKEICKRYGIS